MKIGGIHRLQLCSLDDDSLAWPLHDETSFCPSLPIRFFADSLDGPEAECDYYLHG